MHHNNERATTADAISSSTSRIETSMVGNEKVRDSYEGIQTLIPPLITRGTKSVKLSLQDVHSVDIQAENGTLPQDDYRKEKGAQS